MVTITIGLERSSLVMYPGNSHVLSRKKFQEKICIEIRY